MRPAAFRDHLVGLLKNTPGVGKVDVVEGGPHPYALAATVAGRERRWQVIGQLADGAKHDIPTPAVQAGPPAFTEAPLDGAPDAWLAGGDRRVGAGGYGADRRVVGPGGQGPGADDLLPQRGAGVRAVGVNPSFG